ncbi:membrane protein insertase YidC [Actinokineospora xionganensis]|uniref:Membrane protein insertase YidC n=1 Tax=Actinokineospora xionganensis TaxID=2684470 RepID=A0ABR7LGE2_9PSEU|nr:membrane protein insertase YidC [Actinokineospora xionganensis]MBC6451632.1 membrane protein insertase YidC [Actinokineospora xionganensis]
MFDVFLYPVSAVLWFWHLVFDSLLGSGGAAWVLAVVFLVFTIRALLVRPALSQLRAARRTQKVAPQVQKIREKYKGDQARMVAEIQKLHADNGSNPLGGCLPALLQIPAFLSLFWVLRGFTPGAESNYVFDRAGVESFLTADLFGAKLGNWLSQPTADLIAFGTDRAHMVAVGVPLIVLAGLATFLTMRMSLRRQDNTTSPQLAAVSKAMMYLAPIGMLVSGAFFPLPIGVLLYFLAGNLWTFVQQHILTSLVDGEDHPQETRRR